MKWAVRELRENRKCKGAVSYLQHAALVCPRFPFVLNGMCSYIKALPFCLSPALRMQRRQVSHRHQLRRYLWECIIAQRHLLLLVVIVVTVSYRPNRLLIVVVDVISPIS